MITRSRSRTEPAIRSRRLSLFGSYLANPVERDVERNQQGHRGRSARSTTPGSVSRRPAGGAGMPSRSVQ